jgi:hypothetical protein
LALIGRVGYAPGVVCAATRTRAMFYLSLLTIG